MQKDIQQTQAKKTQSKNKYSKQAKIITKQVKILSGFFPVFLFFEVKKTKQIDQFYTDIQCLLKEKNIKYLMLSDLHITVTKTLNLLQSEIPSLISKIEKSFNQRMTLPIALLFKGITLLSNFICLQVQQITSQRLRQITERIGLTIPNPYFENPVYHISLFKLGEEIGEEFKNILLDMRVKERTTGLLRDFFMSAGSKQIRLKVN